MPRRRGWLANWRCTTDAWHFSVCQVALSLAVRPEQVRACKEYDGLLTVFRPTPGIDFNDGEVLRQLT